MARSAYHVSGRGCGGLNMGGYRGLEPIIDEHCAHLARLNRQPRSIYARRRVLIRCAIHVQPRTLLTADVDDLRSYVTRPRRCDGQPRAAESRKNEVVHLRGFYRWALLEELLVRDPTLRLERPRVSRRLPRPMPDDHVLLALTQAPERIRPWLHFAAYAGLRACEIAPLRASDVVGNVLVIREQKGGDEGAVPLSPLLKSIIRELPREGWWFPHQGHGPYGPTSAAQVSKLSNVWLHSVGISHTLHTLRHWFGTNVYADCRDLRRAQELMRHRSSASTELYTAIDPGEAAATVSRLPNLTGRPVVDEAA